VLLQKSFFLIVILKNTDISQGSVVTPLGCCGVYSEFYCKLSVDSDSEIILKIG